MMKRFWAFGPIILFSLISWLWPVTGTAQENEFTEPMRFSVIGEGVELAPLEIDYDLEAQNSLRFGDILINSKTLEVQLGLVEDLSPALMPFLTEEERADSYLTLRWPEALITEGVVEAISQSGRVMWKRDVPRSEIMKWKDFQTEVRERMAEKLRKGEMDAVPMLTTTWGVSSFLRNNNDFVNSTEPFRFCVTQSSSEGQTRMCMPYMEFVRVDRKWTLRKTPEPIKPARVIFNQKESPLKLRQVIKAKAFIQYLADLSEGHIFEFSTTPPKIEISELVKFKDGVKVVGFGQVPSQSHALLNPRKKSFLTEALGWEQTIGDFREFWETKITEENPTLFFRGVSGGLFRQDFRIKRLPREEARPYLHRRTMDGSYVDGKRFYGIKATKTQVGSKESSLQMFANDEFTWRFSAELRGDMNRSHIQVKDGKEVFRAYAEAFKGYPGEIGFRMPLILGTGGNFLAAGEFAANYWLDTVGGWNHYYLSQQRWGFGGKYLQTLTQVKIAAPGREFSESMKTIALDLKYRFQPGLWNRDESVGMILGYNNITYNFFKASMLGTGIFWARSMPKVFDDLFNKVPFMRYPKWVDMEFIYYVHSLESARINLKQFGQKNTSGSVSSGNWSLNFHGKIHWTKSFFGEGGFGMRSLDFLQTNPSDSGNNDDIGQFGFKFALVYGTFGLGYQF